MCLQSKEPNYRWTGEARMQPHYPLLSKVMPTIAQPAGVSQVQSLSVVPGGRSAALRAYVEGQLRSHPDSSCGRSGAHRAGSEAGRPAPHALWPLVLEGLQEAQRTSLWTADRVSYTFSSWTDWRKCYPECDLEWSAFQTFEVNFLYIKLDSSMMKKANKKRKTKMLIGYWNANMA